MRVAALDIVIVRGVDVIGVRPVVVRMIGSVRRAGLVLVGAGSIAHARSVRSIRTSGTTQMRATTTYSANETNGATATGSRAIGMAAA